MSLEAPQFIFCFLDGVGLGGRQPGNPFAAKAVMPFLTSLLGCQLVADAQVEQSNLLLKPIDACLGIPGLPQSATGQTALYTGCNASQFLGRHLSAFPGGSLRSLIAASGLFQQVQALGGKVAHANLYSTAYFEAIAQRRLRYSVGTLLSLTAKVPFRLQPAYERGEAIFWDITGDLALQRGITAPAISPQEAGRRLALLGGQHQVTLFECYLTDFAGHGQDWQQALQVLQRVDTFLAGLVETLPANVTLVLSSDHGNLEDLGTKRHTLNPVPLLVVGNQAKAFSEVQAITDITPQMVSLIQRSQLAKAAASRLR
ncbi:MAG: alkaline phosphatase family protein [Leptolyngbya sp. SIO4C5]|nr:alkaline phosphatase family protein [Leptolyngbya sp. SIO4C5]